MAKVLTQVIENQISKKTLKIDYTFEVADNDYSSYLMSWQNSSDISFGSMSGTFVLHNPDGIFSVGGANEINVGDKVELIENYGGDTTNWKRFYGKVEQRSIGKSGTKQTITLICLDYISVLKKWDIDLIVEGTRVKVENEILTPNYLDSPNENMAQLFNFANDSIATKPLPFIKIVDKTHDFVDPQFDGFEIYYSTGQLKLGCPLQVRHNYDLKATYYYYTRGINAEDILEEILTQQDSYGGFLFEETSAQAVIDNHLTTTFNTEQGTSIDTLTPNAIAVTLTIETTLITDVSAGDTSIELDSIDGFPTPESGETVECSINGDIFTYSSIGSGNTLSGIPSTGSYALKAHNSGDYVEYEASYPAGQVWYLSYSNLITDLITSDFTLPSGSTVDYHHKRGTQDGSLIILDSAISITEVVTCNTNYSFKTLQTTGIQLNQMSFRPREMSNALEAISRVREKLAPNYIIRTEGSEKIWASYLKQKVTEDYTLNLIRSLDHLEDEDLYTRVIMYRKNENPTNIMFEDDVEFIEEDQSYYGTATKEELYYMGEEKSGILSSQAQAELDDTDLWTTNLIQQLSSYINEEYINKDYATQAPTGYHIYTSPMSNRGKIILEDITPIVYINNIPVDNKIHQMPAMPIKVKVRTETITSGSSKSKSTSVVTYYYYNVVFPHSSIVPDKPIYLYDAQGILVYTVSANSPDVDYANGIATVPGNEQNSLVESFSTATYWVNYSTDKIVIDYDNVVFKIHKSILPNPTESIIRATFEYWDVVVPIKEIDNIVDGRRDTQIQLGFFGEPPSGYVLGVLDLGETKNIQAIDIIPGYFKPDEYRKFDVGCRASLYYSIDGVTYSAISDKLDNFELNTGDVITFDEGDLGANFQARYIKVILQSVDRIDYGRGLYVVAIAEVAMYDNIVLKAEVTLIPTTALTQDANPEDGTVHVTSTAGFTDPESGDETAYIGTDSFTYTGLTSTTFTGCTIESGIEGIIGDRVSQTLESDTTLYDDDGLLPKLGDRVFKEVKISDGNVYNQSELNDLAKAYEKEFYKNHSKKRVNVFYSPHLFVGQTVRIIDATNNTDERVFIEGIKDTNGAFQLTVAKYP